LFVGVGSTNTLVIEREWESLAAMEAAYPYVEIWESWTEVQLRRGMPNALAWGHRGGESRLYSASWTTLY
jgi:hypothetical protein